jgi:hypothetical protein
MSSGPSSLSLPNLDARYERIFSQWRRSTSQAVDIDQDAPVFDSVKRSLSIRPIALLPEDLKKAGITDLHAVAALPAGKMSRNQEGPPQIRIFFSRSPEGPVEFFALQPGKYEFDQIVAGKLRWPDLVLQAVHKTPREISMPFVYDNEDPYLPLDERRDYPQGTVILGGKEFLHPKYGLQLPSAGLQLWKRLSEPKNVLEEKIAKDYIDKLAEGVGIIEPERASLCEKTFFHQLSIKNLGDGDYEGDVIITTQLKTLFGNPLFEELDRLLNDELSKANIAFSLDKYLENSSPSTCKYRAQAATAAPFFFDYLSSSPELTEQIDQGRNPHEVLAARFGCNVGVVKRLAFANMALNLIGGAVEDVNDANEVANRRIDQVMKGLHETDVNLLGSLDDKNSLHDHELYFLSVMRHWEEMVPLPDGEILKTLPPPWRSQTEKLVSYHAFDGVKQADDAGPIGGITAENFAREMPDFLNDSTTKIIEIPLLARGLTLEQIKSLKQVFDPEIFRTVFNGRSATQMLKTCNEWHENAANRGRTAATGDEWLPLTEEVKAPEENGGLSIVPLTTEAKLADEGSKERMSHCVGMYGHACMYEGSHIVSLRDETGKSIATAELKAKGKGVFFKVEVTSQFMGPDNTYPIPEARQSLDWYIEGINSGAIGVNATLLEEVQKQRQGNYEARIAGMNPAERIKLYDEHLQKLQRFLPKKYQGLDSAAFLNQSGLQLMIDFAPVFLCEFGEDAESFAPDGKRAHSTRAVMDLYRNPPVNVGQHKKEKHRERQTP